MLTVSINNRVFTVQGERVFSPAEERELALWLQGYTVDQAAAIECRSADTVRAHRKAIRAKTGQQTGIGALMFCLCKGIISLDQPAVTPTQADIAHSRLRAGQIRAKHPPARVTLQPMNYADQDWHELDLPAFSRKSSRVDRLDGLVKKLASVLDFRANTAKRVSHEH